MSNLANTTNRFNTENQIESGNSDFSHQQKLGNWDLFSARPISSQEKSGKPNLPPGNTTAPPENTPPAAMSLEEIRHELRLISGTPLRADADRLRRMTLWRTLDARTHAWGCK